MIPECPPEGSPLVFELGKYLLLLPLVLGFVQVWWLRNKVRQAQALGQQSIRVGVLEYPMATAKNLLLFFYPAMLASTLWVVGLILVPCAVPRMLALLQGSSL